MSKFQQKQRHQKRIHELVNAFKNGQEFVIHGELGLMGSMMLPAGFHKIPQYDGFISEITFCFKKERESSLKRVLQYAHANKKPVLVLDDGLIYEITQEMNLNQALEKREKTEEKKESFLDAYDKSKEDIKNKANEKYKKLTIVNQPLWSKLIEENIKAPFMDYVPINLSKDSLSRIKKLTLYARILEGKREEEGQITPSAISIADDISDLSFDLKKMSRNDPTVPECRFEGLRFWADVILARTWKYGDELMRAEGFTKEEIEEIKTHPILPTRYTYWENLSHPYMRDLRVTTFYRGESEPTIQSSHKSRKINLSKEHQKD